MEREAYMKAVLDVSWRLVELPKEIHQFLQLRDSHEGVKRDAMITMMQVAHLYKNKID
jgi:hypothetical protein